MTIFFQDAYSILWADLRYLSRDWKRTFLTSLISPVLYLVAFGFGLGRSVDIGGGSYLAFVIPGIIALSCMNSSFNGAGMRLNVDRLFYKSFDELLMNPMSLNSIIMGKASVGVLRGLITTTPLIIGGMFLAPELSISWEFILSLLISLSVFSLLGVLAAFMARSHQDMSTFSTLIILPMTFLCGTFFSIDKVPEFLKWFLYVLPLTHTSQILRAGAMDTAFPWLSVLVLAMFGAVFFGLTYSRVKKLSI
ncbi:MAG: Inner membrane transport permease YadH [Dehalococcoides mccartyi]|nr:Inner membrane transport permease YadH [Dehalococcoides mccartyi]